MNYQIAENGVAQMIITIPEDPTPSERYAAEELRYYLERITAIPFEIAEGEQEGRQFALGRAAEKLVSVPEGLGEEGFYLHTAEGSLCICGGKRGVLYGVYAFLEELGCRFFTADCEKIPADAAPLLPELDDHQLPAFEYRDHNYYQSHEYVSFAPKLRLNGERQSRNPEKFGGTMNYAVYVHSFDLLVPSAEYGKTHPEYYSMRADGTRHADYPRTQLCLSNPEVLEIAVGNARKILLAHPDARIISISQNDWHEGCQCPACREIDREEGSPSGALLRFVNAIAERLEPEFPDVIFDTLAYQYTRPAPRVTRPRKNVCVRLCSIECCFSHPLETCSDRRAVRHPDGTETTFVEDLRNWAAVSDRLYIWDYVTSFSHYAAPHPNWRTLQPNMKTFRDNHVRGVFEQANGAKKGGCDLNELRAYVISKLLWNPDTDVNRHIREFTEYYYGRASRFILQYMDILCDEAEEKNIHIGFNDPCDSPLFSPEILSKLEHTLDSARKAVSDDPLRLYRVGKLGLSVRYLRLKLASMNGAAPDPEEINRFFSDWQSYGLSRMEEWVSPKTSHRALIRHIWRGVEFHDHWFEEGAEEL